MTRSSSPLANNGSATSDADVAVDVKDAAKSAAGDSGGGGVGGHATGLPPSSSSSSSSSSAANQPRFVLMAVAMMVLVAVSIATHQQTVERKQHPLKLSISQLMMIVVWAAAVLLVALTELETYFLSSRSSGSSGSSGSSRLPQYSAVPTSDGDSSSSSSSSADTSTTASSSSGSELPPPPPGVAAASSSSSSSSTTTTTTTASPPAPPVVGGCLSRCREPWVRQALLSTVKFGTVMMCYVFTSSTGYMGK
jgi:hypothetical protein